MNIDDVKFNPTGSCKAGGLYFTNLDNLGSFYDYGNMVAIIRIPDGAMVCEDPSGNKWKAYKFIIERFESIDDYWKNLIFCTRVVEENCVALKYVKNQTPELCMRSIEKLAIVLVYVNEQTPELCARAVEKNVCVLAFVKEQTSEICMKAIKQDSPALQYVVNQIPELCMQDVIQNGNSLKYIKNKNQTPVL